MSGRSAEQAMPEGGDEKQKGTGGLMQEEGQCEEGQCREHS